MRNRSLGAIFFVAFHLASAAEPDTVVVTASRFPDSNLDLPLGVDLLQPPSLYAPGSHLPDLLESAGGMVSRGFGGSPDRMLDLRGFGATGDQNTLLLIDGMRFTENELVPARLTGVSPNTIERIEILRGAGAVLFGGGATGGTVNVITRAPQPGARELRLAAGAGSYASNELRLDATIASEVVGVSFDGLRAESDNYRSNNHLAQYNGAATVYLTGADASARLNLQSDRQRLRLPGALTDLEIAADRRASTHPDDYGRRDADLVRLSLNAKFGAAEWALDALWRDKHEAAFFGDYVFHLFDFYRDVNADAKAISPRLRLAHEAFGVPQKLIAGVDLRDWDYTALSASNEKALATPFSKVQAAQETRALYLANDWLFTERLRVSLGARRERASESLIDRVPGFSPAQSERFTASAWHAALRLGLERGASLYGRAGKSFRFATVDENAFTDTGRLLRPQRSKDVEVGADYRIEHASAHLGAFRSRLQDEISFNPLIQIGFFFGANTNLEPTERRGVELAGRWSPSPSWEFDARAQWLRAEFVSGTYGGVDVAGNEVPLAPKQTLHLRAAHRLGDHAEIALAARQVGTQRFDNDQANTFARMPAYRVFDLSWSQRWQDLQLTAAIRNLGNEKYFSYGVRNAAGTGFNAYPEAERSLAVALSYTFH